MVGRSLHDAELLPTPLRRADTVFMVSTSRTSSNTPAPVGAVWTVHDLEQLPDDGHRYEVLHGELLVTPLPSVGHQWVAANLTRLIGNSCATNTGWCFFAPSGVHVSETTWLEPDLAVYSVPMSPELAWRTMPAPVLVVEVLSASTRSRDRYRKRPAYLAHGVGEVWLLDLRERVVEKWTSASEFPELHREGITWHPVDSVPALTLSADALFGPVRAEP